MRCEDERLHGIKGGVIDFAGPRWFGLRRSTTQVLR